MMDEVSHRTNVEYIPPPLPPKIRQKGSTTLKITSDDKLNEFSNAAQLERSSMHSLVLNTAPPATVFVAATRPDRDGGTSGSHVGLTDPRPHVVTIRVNTEKSKPKISSVHLKSDADFETFKLQNKVCKKNNSLVTITLDERSTEDNEDRRGDRAPYINCNSYMNSMNTVMSSGQCSPSDTLDSGTCSDLDGTPPPLPKKKTSKTSTRKKAITVTIINSNSTNNNEMDFEDNDSNISCDSLNSSELNGSVHTDESHDEKVKKCKETAQELPFANAKDGFLPCNLLQDIRDRTTKLSNIETKINTNIKQSNETCTKEDKKPLNDTQSNNRTNTLKTNVTKTPIVIETTYEEREREDDTNKTAQCYSGIYFDTDKYYDFHLNEKQFDEVKSASVNSVDEADGVEYFAGVKDFKNEDAPSTIKSSKGTIRGVKNRVRAGIATFLQINNASKSYREKDAGKVVLYTTTMGIVRSTYQRCVLVKKILRNLLVKYEERDVFMSTEYQDEIRDRMKSEKILVPQLFIDGQHIGDADTVEKLNECGELRKMLKPYKSPDACTTCQMCGGFRLLPCRICNGSKKSLHRNHFTAEFVALKCMNCDEVGLVKCEACS